MRNRTAGWLGARAAAIVGLFVAGGCGIDEARPSCVPGEAACPAAGASREGGVSAIDPRIEGPGMRGDALPHWPMFHHDAQHTGRNGVAAPADGALQWTFRAEGEIWSSPAIALDGTVYFGSLDHKLYAVSPRGKLKWTFETLAPIFASPAVAGDGTVYIGSLDAHLYALRDGAMKWSAPMHNCAFSSPALAKDGTIYIGSNAWVLYAFSPNGEERWQWKTKAGI